MNTIQRIFVLAYTALTDEERKELTRLLKKMALAVIAGTGLLVAISSYLQPAKVVEDKVLEPAGVALSILENPCHDGWKAMKNEDEDAIVRGCTRTIEGVEWQVILKPDGSFDHATPLNTPGARHVFEEKAVPRW